MNDNQRREEVFQIKGRSFSLGLEDSLGKKKLFRIRRKIKRDLIVISNKKINCQIIRAADGSAVY